MTDLHDTHYRAWSDRWRDAGGGDHLPALGYVPGPVRELQDPVPISEAEARALLPAEVPMTAGEWCGWALFLAVWICLCALLTWLKAGIGLGDLYESMKACVGR
jgi:hypothetical protein